MFTDIFARYPDIGNMFSYGIYVAIALAALVIVKIGWKGIVTRSVRSQQAQSGMDFGTLDKMKGAGAISDEEAKKIRQAMARQMLQHTEEERRALEERSILAQAAYDPDAARALLPEQYRDKNNTPAPAGDARKKPEPAPEPEPEIKLERPSDLGIFATPADDAPRPAPSATTPLFNKETPETARQKPHQKPQPKGELEILLEKGVLTREQYDALKKQAG